MIRVIYRWRVATEQRSEFATWWHDGTVRISESFRGALGSTLLRPVGDDGHVVAIARWKSQQDLESFWADPGGTPFDDAQLISVEILEEVDDLTSPG